VTAALNNTEQPYEVVCRDSDPDWIRHRMSMVGASEASAIVGANKYDDALSVYLRKRGLVQDLEESEPMRWGKLLETPIANEFCLRTGRTAFGGGELLRSTRWPFMGCTLDREITRPDRPDPGVLEIKTAGPWLEDEWSEGVPLGYQVQVQHQLAVTGRKWGSVAALIGGQKLVWCDVEWHAAFIATLTAKMSEFWQCVTDGTPPPASLTEVGRAALERLYPNDNGQTISLDAEAVEWYEELTEITEREKELKTRKTAIQARVIETLGEATYGMLPHGRGRFSAKWIEKAAFSVKPQRYREVRRLK
jgi:putative phage-type endonuclease